jgi:hypothetical protein
MVIIGIIITVLLVVGNDARRRAEEDATLALITKLDTALNDRLDALLQTRPDPTPGHQALAAIYSATATLQSPARAQVIAWCDFIKRELPDVFFVQDFNPGSPSSPGYPLNFAANLFPKQIDPNLAAVVTAVGGNWPEWILPLDAGYVLTPPPPGTPTFSPGEGIYGASYFAAAGVYKNLGYLPAGYDGVDNDGNGRIDEWAEGVNAPPNYTVSPPSPTNPLVTVQQVVQGNLNLHQHHTARAEMLYAILVEGVGPLGSAFSPDDFTDREVKDTDGDGLPEFVDAWGQPLQFFRWPLLYHTDSQKGQLIANMDCALPYLSTFEAREQDPLDPNQQLVAPMWWSSVNAPYLNGAFSFPGNAQSQCGTSNAVNAFEYFLHRLTEPMQGGGGANYWDRGTTYPYRRAFFTKPLILSGGPDKQLGVFLYPNGTPGTSPVTATQLLMVENNAMQFALVNDFTNAGSYTIAPLSAVSGSVGDYDSYDPNNLTGCGLQESGKDDISNQNRQASIGAGGP